MRDVSNAPAGHHDQQAFSKGRVQLHHKSFIQREDRELRRLVRWMNQQTISGNMHKLLQGATSGTEDPVTVTRRRKQNRKVTIVIASGGDFGPGSPAFGYNFAEPYLRAILGFIGLSSVSFVYAPNQNAGEEAARVGLADAKKAAAAAAA